MKRHFKSLTIPILIIFLVLTFVASVIAALTSTDSVVTIQKGKSVRETVATVVSTANQAAGQSSPSVTATAGNITVTDKADGNNAGVKYQFVGLPKIKLLGLGAGTNGTTSAHTQILTDDSPAGEWSAVDSGTTVSADTTYYKAGTTSLKILFKTTATTTSGAAAAPSSIDLSTDASIGMWIYSTKVLAAGDLVLKITDTVAGATSLNVPAVATANKWTWVEVDISGVTSTSRDVVNGLSLTLSAAGVVKSTAGQFSVYVDFMVAWAAADEKALSTAVLQDGILGVVGTTYTATADPYLQTLTNSTLAEYTNYFVAYRSGNDSLVCITDLSKTLLTGLVAY